MTRHMTRHCIKYFNQYSRTRSFTFTFDTNLLNTAVLCPSCSFISNSLSSCTIMGMGMSNQRCIRWAAQDGRTEDLLFHLCQEDPSIALKSVADDQLKRRPIHLAAERGHARCVQILWEAGSALDCIDKDGHTPLHLAAAHQHYATVQVLLELGADVCKSTRFGVTPLHIATSSGHTPCVELLAEWGANVNTQESWGQTPLVIATTKSRLQTMVMLISLGAELEVKDYHHGQTALHVACAGPDENTVLILLDAGADLTATDGRGLSPLGIALVNKFYRCVPLLLEYGARLNHSDIERLPGMLVAFVQQQCAIPLSMLRLTRVILRQRLGPAKIDTINSMGLPPHIVEFMHNILGLCDGSAYKAVAVKASSSEIPLKPLNHTTSPGLVVGPGPLPPKTAL